MDEKYIFHSVSKLYFAKKKDRLTLVTDKDQNYYLLVVSKYAYEHSYNIEKFQVFIRNNKYRSFFYFNKYLKKIDGNHFLVT